jgi:hypothetical protein
MVEEKKPQFPIVNEDACCPHCKSTEVIGQAYLDQLEAEGKVPKGSVREGLTMQFPITAILLGSLVSVKPEMPVVCISVDICASCFTVYARKVWVIMQPVQVRMQGIPPPGFSNPGKEH